MVIKFRCSNCHVKIAVNEDLAGERIKCPGCGKNMNAPMCRFGSGTKIGDYEIEQWLGSGSMGEVHLANHGTMNKKVALKMMLNQLGMEEEDVQRFIREIHNQAKLNHNNIVGAINAGEFDGGYYLAMEFVEGDSLEEIITNEGPMDEKRALKTCLGIVSAMEYIWDKENMIHRDLKPSNIMIDKEGVSKLMDLGVAKRQGQDIDLTAPGMTVGTPYYMSPEQAQAQSLDQRSDIYGLGATLYHIVTGQAPYEGGSSIEVMSKKLSEPPIKVRELNDKISKPCCDLIFKMMRLKPENRHQSWEEVRTAMEDVLKGKSSSGAKKKIKVDTMDNQPQPQLRDEPLREGNGKSVVPILAGIAVLLIVILFLINR